MATAAASASPAARLPGATPRRARARSRNGGAISSTPTVAVALSWKATSRISSGRSANISASA